MDFENDFVKAMDAYMKLLKSYLELEQKYFDLQKENERLRYQASEYRQSMIGGIFI